jgi:hypothetical protein
MGAPHYLTLWALKNIESSIAPFAGDLLRLDIMRDPDESLSAKPRRELDEHILRILAK